MTVAALYVDPRGPYPKLGADCWDKSRDASAYAGPWSLVAHVTCGPWGKLRHMCGAETLAEEWLGPVAIEQVRRWGGVLEHPAESRLFRHTGAPHPGELPDAWGGITIAVEQWWWGHRAAKPTWLYIVGPSAVQGEALLASCEAKRLAERGRRRPPSGKAKGRGDPNRSMTERLPRTQRHLTPPAFAEWLMSIAARCQRQEAA